MDLLKTFVEYELVFVPRSQNILANGWACAAISYQRSHSDKQLIIQTKYRPLVPNNEKYWHFFEGEKQIEDLLLSRNEFELPDSNLNLIEESLDKEPLDEEKPFPTAEINMLTKEF